MSNDIKRVRRKFSRSVKGYVNKCGDTWVHLYSHKENEIVKDEKGNIKYELLPASLLLKFKKYKYDFKGIGYVVVTYEPQLQLDGGNISETGWIEDAKFKNDKGEIVTVPKIESINNVGGKEDEVKMSDIF